MVKSKELDNDSNLLLFLSLLKPCPPLQHETYQKSFVFAHVGLDRYGFFFFFFKIFFWKFTIFRSFIEFITILLLFFILVFWL